MGRGHGATRGGGAGGTQSVEAQRAALYSSPREPIKYGTESYKQAQAIATTLEFQAKGVGLERDGRGRIADNWSDFVDNINFATQHVSKYGNDFEKAVAASVAKTVRPYGTGARQPAFISQRQAWVLGKAMAETHVERWHMPW